MIVSAVWDGVLLVCARSGCAWVRDEDVLHALGHAGGLLRLNVSCCDALSDAVLRVLPRLCPGLRALDVCYAASLSLPGALSPPSSPPRATRPLARARCPVFARAQDAGCYPRRRTSARIAISGPLRALPCVCARACAGLMHCCLAYPAAQLTDLGCSGFGELLDSHLATLLRHQGAGMTMLGVGGCEHLTDHALALVAQHCPGLAELYVSHCPQLSGPALLRLLEVRAPAVRARATWCAHSGAGSAGTRARARAVVVVLVVRRRARSSRPSPQRALPWTRASKPRWTQSRSSTWGTRSLEQPLA